MLNRNIIISLSLSSKEYPLLCVNTVVVRRSLYGGDVQNHCLSLAEEKDLILNPNSSYQLIGKLTLSTQDVLRLTDDCQNYYDMKMSYLIFKY